MARLNIELPDELMLAFRRAVLARYGTLRGKTGEAVEESLRWYISQAGKEVI